MTIQEIIESINYCLECDNDRIPTTQEDLRTIKEALKKQIPKKPTCYKVELREKKAGYEIRTEYGRSYSCPRCERFLSDRYDWCYACGQALDWSEYND